MLRKILQTLTEGNIPELRKLWHKTHPKDWPGFSNYIKQGILSKRPTKTHQQKPTTGPPWSRGEKSWVWDFDANEELEHRLRFWFDVKDAIHYYDSKPSRYTLLTARKDLTHSAEERKEIWVVVEWQYTPFVGSRHGPKPKANKLTVTLMWVTQELGGPPPVALRRKATRRSEAF